MREPSLYHFLVRSDNRAAYLFYFLLHKLDDIRNTLYHA